MYFSLETWGQTSLTPWFSANFATAMFHRNYFFDCTNRINRLNIKWISDRIVIIGRFLKLLNLHILIKPKSLLLSIPWLLTLGSYIADSVLNKDKSAIPPLFNSPGVSSATDKIKLLICFLKTLILMTQVSLYLLSFLIWNCIIFL